MMMCPYEVPQYNQRLGIVRKCDLCSARLRHGELPACVQGCPNSAIRVRRADQSQAGEPPPLPSRLVPTAPPSELTRPTTVYLTKKNDLYNETVQPQSSFEVQDGHGPLAWLLVLSQAAIGCMGSGLLLVAELRLVVWASLLLMALAVGIGTLHLGQPLRAWRMFLGFRTSWLSRESLVFGALLGALSLATVVPDRYLSLTLFFGVLLGSFGIYCSAMIYIATRREVWRMTRTAALFAGSAISTGLMLTPVLQLTSERHVYFGTVVLAILSNGSKLYLDTCLYRLGKSRKFDRATVQLVSQHLQKQFCLRMFMD